MLQVYPSQSTSALRGIQRESATVGGWLTDGLQRVQARRDDGDHLRSDGFFLVERLLQFGVVVFVPCCCATNATHSSRTCFAGPRRKVELQHTEEQEERKGKKQCLGVWPSKRSGACVYVDVWLTMNAPDKTSKNTRR